MMRVECAIHSSCCFVLTAALLSKRCQFQAALIWQYMTILCEYLQLLVAKKLKYSTPLNRRQVRGKAARNKQSYI